MDEQQYMKLAEAAFRKIIDSFEDIDIDDADVESAGDVITMTFRGGARCVVNTQRPTRQIWLAGGARAWHFSYDADRSSWFDDRGTGEELFQTIRTIVREATGLELPL